MSCLMVMAVQQWPLIGYDGAVVVNDRRSAICRHHAKAGFSTVTSCPAAAQTTAGRGISQRTDFCILFIRSLFVFHNRNE